MKGVTTYRLRATAGICLSMLLASCGGGGGGGDGVAVAQDSVRLACQVADQVTGAAVADANVTYQAGATTYATTTDAAGSCELNLPASEVAGIAYPAASVDKAGYEPQTVLYSTLAGGGSYPQNVVLTPLADNVSVPVGGEVVMHLGDDLFAGSTNSQFQKKTDGLELTFAIADWADQVAKGYTKATVYLDAKGWESRSCMNLVSLVGEVGMASLPGGDSPADGSWAGGKQVPFDFPIAGVGVQRAEVRVTSGNCNGTADHDDFEINRIRVYFS